MDVPIFSTITLFTEIFVSLSIIYVFYSGYKKNKFPTVLAFTTLAYEVLFNISYMVYKILVHTESAGPEPVQDIIIAATHGILSLIMFISLIVFIIVAWKNYKKKINYFKSHKRITFAFLFFWFLSVLSGILFYFIEYYKIFY